MSFSSKTEQVWKALMAIQRQCWEQGLASQAAIALGKTDEMVMLAHDAVLRQGDDGRLALIENTIAIADPAASGMAVKKAFEITADARYEKALDKMTHYILKSAPRASNGAVFQLLDRNQVWVDSMGMVPPYLVMVGEVKEAVAQVKAVIELLWNSDKQLFSHMYDDDRKAFEREAFWTSGNGWALYGLVTMLSELGEDYLDDKAFLRTYFTTLVDSMKQYQLENGLFYDVIDDSDTFVETNGAQMFAYAVFEGIEQGILDESYRTYAEKAFVAATEKVDSYGFVKDAAGSPDFVKPGTSAEAQVFYILMETARLQSEQKR